MAPRRSPSGTRTATQGFDFASIPVVALGHPLPFLNSIQRSFGRHDVSRVRAHIGGLAAAETRRIGAEALTYGADISFARAPSLHTAAHEAAHVIQQRSGVQIAGSLGARGDAYERQADQVADRVATGQSSETLFDAQPGAGAARGGEVRAAVQLRRIPTNVQALLVAAGGGNGPNFVADADGAQRLIDSAMAELTPAQVAQVTTARLAGLTEPQFSALPRREQLSRHANAIIAQVSGLKLGDPTLLDVHPRPGTADDANIAKVVGHANSIFADIATGARDPWLTQVFGSASVAAAKAKYAAARAAMNRLHKAKHIVTDRGSGFSGEVEEGGLSNSDQISVAPDVIDSPDDNESIVTFIHESMHAGNPGIADDVYIDDKLAFPTQTTVEKLKNAAHFEVVPWRILDPASPSAWPADPPTVPPTFQTFIPPGTTVGGVSAPPRTTSESAATAAYERLNAAWRLGLNLHRQYVHLFARPKDWTVPQFGGAVRFNNSIPFWSKVEKLTIHDKTVIDPASPDEAKHPVSQIDVALSEGVTRKLALGMDVLNSLETEAEVNAFETAGATPAELATAFPPGGIDPNVALNTERGLLLKLAVRDPRVKPITGTEDRDLRVVLQMGNPALVNWDDVLKPRNPASFAD